MARRKAQLGLSVTDGGTLIPIGKNIFLAQGRTHDEGGIGISYGKKYNAGGNLEIEDKEILQVVGGNTKFVGNGKFKSGGQEASIRVFSSVPFLRGVSPAQLVMEGANPDVVFKAQEEFKDRNRINDDGTRYQTGGQKKSNSAIRTEADKKVPAYNRAVYSLVDPTMGYPTKKEAVGYAIGAGIKAMRNPNDMVYWVTDSVSDAAWRKRHGLSYDNKFLIPNEDGSVRLPKDREMEIPTDTTMLKNRIAANKKLAERYPEGSEKRDIVDWALRVDGMALDSLRHTYKTGEPVTINEGAYNSRRLINNGELNYPEIMPHNVMQNYAIQYDKSKDKMNYWDTYNFNEFEWGVPGKPFEIRGSIPLKRYGGSKQDDTKTAALKRLRNKFTITGNYGGGLFGGAGAGSVIMEQPEYVNDTITKRYLVPVTQTFNDAFGDAVNAGLDKFMFDNKWYNTDKGNNPNNNAAGAARTQTVIIPIEHKEVRRRKKEFGGNMIYEINGNVKNGLMSARPKAKYGLATKYLKKRNSSDKQKSENISNNKISYDTNNGLKIGLGTVGGLGVAGITSYGLTKLENYLNEVTRPSLEISQKALDEYNEKYVRKTQGKTTKGFTPRNPLKSSGNNIQYQRLNINEHNIGLYDSKDPIVRATIRARGLNPKRVTADGSFKRSSSNLSNIEQRKLDKDYRKVVGNKEPKSGFGAKPASKVITAEYPNTNINSKPVNIVGKTYDPTVEFKQANKPKPKPNPGLNNYLKKITRGVKGLGVIGSLLDIYNNLFPSEEVETLENLRVRMDKTNKDLTSRRQTKYGGRIKAEGGKFLKYKNGIFTDPETGEEFEVDPEVFKMYGNTKESGVIPIADYTKGTFDNAHPQFYAEKRLPIAGSQSIAEKAGLARSGWSYADIEPITFNYVPNIDLSIPDNYGKGSTPRRGETKPTSSKATSKPTPTLRDNINQITRNAISRSIAPKIDLSKVEMPTFDVSQLGSKETKAAKAKLNTSPTGGSTESKEASWIPQFNTISTGDWIGLGSNLAGHIASYITNNALLKRFPMPTKPIMAPAAKLKTRYNINPELSETRETELVNRSAVRRNSQSSNTSLAREQRIANEARNARNNLYGQKENIETQLINQDRLNRQSVMARNVSAYNDWLDKTYAAKSNRMLAKQQNLMSLINGIPTAVNNIIGNIESRRNANNTIKVIAAANPNVDGRLLGIGDYYSQRLSDGRVAIYDKNGKLKRIK